ncbi:MAG: hypothetical protein V3T22_06520 [Planctomycetota bacterium]
MAGIRPAWIGGGLIMVLVVAGTWALRDGDAPEPDHGRLQFLMPLTGGVWYERGKQEDEWRSRTEYEWSVNGELLLERAMDPASGAILREGRFFWNGKDQKLAYEAHLPGGEFRDGLFRASEGGLELQYNAHQEDGAVASYKLRIRFLENDEALWTVHRRRTDGYYLDHETTFVRKNR